MRKNIEDVQSPANPTPETNTKFVININLRSNVPEIEPPKDEVILRPFKWNGQTSDVTITIGRFKYHTHFRILNEKLQEMILNELLPDSPSTNLNLDESPICQAVFKEFLKFFYSGETSFTPANLTGMLLLAKKYDVEDLIELCDEYLNESLNSTALIHLMTSLYDNNLNRHYQKLKRFAVKNFERAVLTKKGAPLVPYRILVDLLGSFDDRATNSVRLQYIEKWRQKLELELKFNEDFMKLNTEKSKPAKIPENFYLEPLVIITPGRHWL